MQRDIPPCLLPVIGERSDCRSPVNDGPPNPLHPGPTSATGNGPPSGSDGSGGQVTDDDILKDIVGVGSVGSPETKTAEAMVVEFPSDTSGSGGNKNPEDPSSSPDEEWDDEHTSVRVDFHIYCNEGVRVEDDEDNSSPNDDDDEEEDNNDAKITSDLKAGMANLISRKISEVEKSLEFSQDISSIFVFPLRGHRSGRRKNVLEYNTLRKNK